MERSLGRVVSKGGTWSNKVKNRLYRVKQACEKQLSRAQAQPVTKQCELWPKIGPREGRRKSRPKDKARSKFDRGEMLSADGGRG